MSLRPTLRSSLEALAVASGIVAAYSNHFRNSFHFDDIHTIVDNLAVRSLRHLLRFFTDASTFSVLPPNRTYRPVLSVSLAVDYWLGGYDPWWYHVTSFALFAAQLVLMYVLFTGLLRAVSPFTERRNRLVALLAMSWYGVHPAVAETVNYIVQRGDILSTLGVVAALVAWVRWPGRLIYLIPLVLGLLSKPPAMVFPVLLAAYVGLFGAGWRRALVDAAPSILVTGVVLGFEAWMTPRSFVASDVPYWSYLLTQPYVAMRYFVSFFMPIRLNVDTDLEAFRSVNGQAVVGFVFVAGLILVIFLCVKNAVFSRFGALFVRESRVWMPVGFGLIWFGVGLLPTSLYRLAEVENDHRMYLPFVGLVLAVTYAGALGVEWVASLPWVAARPWVPSAVRVVVVGVLAGYGVGTHRRNEVWRTEETLWLDDVQKSPHNGRGLMIYGLTQMDKGDVPRALTYFERAEVYTPNYATLEVNLGVAHGSLGQAAEAERHFLRAMSLAPADDVPHTFYGRWLMEQVRLPEAVSQLRTAVLLNPARVEPHDLLAEAYAEEGSVDDARAAAGVALAMDAGDGRARAVLDSAATPTPEVWLNRSLAEYRAGRYAESVVSAKRALALRPGYAEAWNNVGAGYAAMGVWDEAIRAEEEALRLEPGLVLARNNLEWAKRERGR